MMARLVVALACALCLAGCPVPPKPPVVVDGGYTTCTGVAQVLTRDICPGFFTREGFACTSCVGVPGAPAGAARGCIDPRSDTYCSAGTCFEDPRCFPADLVGEAPANRLGHVPKVPR